MEKPYDEVRNLPGAQGDDEPADGVRKHLRYPGATGNQEHDVRSILLQKWLAICSILVHSKAEAADNRPDWGQNCWGFR